MHISFLFCAHSGSLPSRYAPFGTTISNRAPLPGSPVSRMVMPVIPRISRARKRPIPVFVPKPRFLIYNATRRCDLSCRHCGIWQAEKREELDAARLEPIIARGFFSKVDTVWLTGGEPFLRKDLAELAKVFRARLPGMRMLGIASNGYATERILGRLEELLAE